MTAIYILDVRKEVFSEWSVILFNFLSMVNVTSAVLVLHGYKAATWGFFPFIWFMLLMTVSCSLYCIRLYSSLGAAGSTDTAPATDMESESASISQVNDAETKFKIFAMICCFIIPQLSHSIPRVVFATFYHGSVTIVPYAGILLGYLLISTVTYVVAGILFSCTVVLTNTYLLR